MKLFAWGCSNLKCLSVKYQIVFNLKLINHLKCPTQDIDAAEGRGLARSPPTRPARLSLSLNLKARGKKGAHYNLRELQPLHEDDMTASATKSRYAYLFSLRQNVSYLCVSYDLILRSYNKVDRCWFGKMY